MDKPTHADIWRELQDISRRIGHENDDGTGGTGLTGRIMRAEAGVRAYQNDRNRILGGLAALSLVAALLVAGFKSWVTSWFPGGTS